MKSPDVVVECQAASRDYRIGDHVVAALSQVDLSVPRGSFTALTGPSGSGKSTLLRLLAGIDDPDSGEVALVGRTLGGLSAKARARLRRDVLGFVRQSPGDNLLAYLTVRQHLRLAAQIRGVADRRQDALLDALGMAGRADHLPHQMSGGEQQRAAIAFAAVGQPAVLLADEPTGQLDHDHVGAVIDAFRVIAGRGVAVVAATHDPAVWERADQVVRLRAGRVEEIS